LGVQRGIALLETFAGYELVIVDTAGGLYYSSGLTPPE
jgi:hypothetical protein